MVKWSVKYVVITLSSLTNKLSLGNPSIPMARDFMLSTILSILATNCHKISSLITGSSTTFVRLTHQYLKHKKYELKLYRTMKISILLQQQKYELNNNVLPKD
uniref:Uncharacterized protein n=1 Tax=Octopus bimaculoides TaxID=37653 RepID=A0A0L8FNQ8_OCTBM